MDVAETFGTRSPIIGMAHLPALPGSPGHSMNLDEIRTQMLADAKALEAGGVDGLLIENLGDVPYYPDDVPPHTVSFMSALGFEMVRAVDVPVGVSVLWNDAEAGLAVASAIGGEFTRVPVHTGVRVTSGGLVEGAAEKTLRLRDRLSTDVEILADIDVKHSAPLSNTNVDTLLTATVERGGADGVIVTGPSTGEPVDWDQLESIVDRITHRGLDVPVFVGSGISEDNVAAILDLADGVIVGTAIKRDGVTDNPVDQSAVESLIEAATD